MADSQLSRLGKSIHLRWHRDGILDIMAGSILLGFGINMATDSPAWMVLSWLPILLYLPLKNLLTLPRSGYVQFHSLKKQRRMLSIALAAGLSLLAGIFVLLQILSTPPSGVEEFLHSHLMLLLSLLFAGMLASAAAVTRSLRFLAYGALSVLLIAGGTQAGLGEPAAVILDGAVILLAGLGLLLQFLRTYPVLNHEPGNG